ncbi:MAG: glycerol-3-phosphate 1-O-acyltransferase PlsY [Proteobacteria bacterium]|uniref:Glycerol-3-phosphate acyltransferase n=1 Tax=Candidatus Enterousia avistercoris TaxID=2840788 RepID=A0A9D9DEE0_9PROT|nr:glycerol-3-phosphate 1-O-acyltransferase PlsY [Candidatus Enterousia avistercoris]
MISVSFGIIAVIGIIISYLLGSIPMGLILTRIMGKGDLRKVGSGNIGATNVMRVGGLRMAGAVWLLDMAKAICAVLIGCAIGGDVFGAWCGFAAVIGHCYPIWLRFRGGKGISSMFGVMLATSPLSFVICGIEWLVVALTSGYSSLGAVVAFCVMPVLGFAISTQMGWPFLAIALVALWRHRENIRRLITGTESKVEWKWKK